MVAILATALRLAPRPRRRRRPRKRRSRMRYPRNVEQDYLSALLELLRQTHARVIAQVVPLLGDLARQAAPRADALRMDAWADVLGAVIDALEEQAQRDTASPGVRALPTSVGQKVNAHSSAETSRVIKERLGLDVVARVPGLDDRMAAFARQNVKLITSLPTDYLYDVEQAALRALREGKRAEDIAAMLEDRYGVAQSRAALIARDQVGKLQGQLSQARQTALGLKRYRWRTSDDERVRPEHRARDGELFSWSDPPEDGHPGQPIQCRCWPDPELDDLLDE